MGVGSYEITTVYERAQGSAVVRLCSLATEHRRGSTFQLAVLKAFSMRVTCTHAISVPHADLHLHIISGLSKLKTLSLAESLRPLSALAIAKALRSCVGLGGQLLRTARCMDSSIGRAIEKMAGRLGTRPCRGSSVLNQPRQGDD